VLLRRITAIEDKSILEIGCGSGGNLVYLFERFRYRVGLDADDDALRFAHRKLEGIGDIVRGDANRLGISDGSFDCVALLDVLYHARVTDVDAVLLDAQRLLKTGGYILITDGAYDFLSGRHSVSVNAARRFTRKNLCASLEAAGFGVVKASYWGLIFFFPLFLKRVLLERAFSNRSDEQHEGHFDLVRIPVVDTVLYYLVKAETWLLPHTDLPFGASICILARKINQ
jgi:SAM-dependent methyltransferase